MAKLNSVKKLLGKQRFILDDDPYKNEFRAVPLNEIGIQAAIDRANKNGVGTVAYAGMDYKLAATPMAKPGVSYRGERTRLNCTGDIPDSAMITAEGGTRLICDPGVYGLAYNNVPQATLPPLNTFSNSALVGIGIENLVSIGGAGLLSIGASRLPGLIDSQLDRLYYFDASDWGINLTNYQQCTFGDFRGRQSVPGGGIRYGTDISRRPGDSALLLLPGNSTWTKRSFIFNSHFAARGVEIYVAPDNQVNQLNWEGGAQVNRFSGNSTGVDMTLSFTNTSADVGFVNPAHYDLMVVGGAFQFKAGAVNWWEPLNTHYVVSKNDANKTVQLSEFMYGTPRTASQTTNTIVMTYGGYPGLALAGSSSSIITNAKLGWWDIEVSGNVTSLYAAGFRGSIDISEIYGSSGVQKATIVARASSLKIKTTYPIGWVESTNSSTVNVVSDIPVDDVRTTGKTLSPLSAGGSSLLTAATTQDFVVAPDLTFGFTYTLRQDQLTAGKARFVPGIGVTLPPLASTAGPGSEITLIQTGKNTYTITGGAVA